MPQVILPTLREGETLEQKMLYLTDNIYKLRKELSFLLGNLDSDNVLEAQSVIADWVYAGGVSANQITAGTISATIGIISPNISGGTITGALYKTTNINNNRIEISGEGFYGYNTSNYRHGPCISPSSFTSAYSSLDFCNNGSVRAYIAYNHSLEQLQISGLSNITIGAPLKTVTTLGNWNFSGANVTLPDFAKQSDVSDAISSHVAAYHSGP